MGALCQSCAPMAFSCRRHVRASEWVPGGAAEVSGTAWSALGAPCQGGTRWSKHPHTCPHVHAHTRAHAYAYTHVRALTHTHMCACTPAHRPLTGSTAPGGSLQAVFVQLPLQCSLQTANSGKVLGADQMGWRLRSGSQLSSGTWHPGALTSHAGGMRTSQLPSQERHDNTATPSGGGRAEAAMDWPGRGG